jgi:hypothetical protein
MPVAAAPEYEPPGFYDGVDVAPAFLHIRPTTEAVPTAIEHPVPDIDAREYRWGRLLWPFVGYWSRRRRERDRVRVYRLLLQISWCAAREDLESLIGAPRLLFFDDNGFRDELYVPDAGNVVLRFKAANLIAIFGLIPFSSAEWGAGTEPERNWQEITPTAAS